MMDEKTVKKNIGNIIRNYRKSFRLTQSELGALIDINQRQIAHIECGYSCPSLSTITKLTEVFHCSIDDLFDFAENEDKTVIFNKINNLLNNCSTQELKQIYKIIKSIKKIQIYP